MKITTSAFRRRALLPGFVALLFAVSATVVQAVDYFKFVPGHGLTGRTAQKTFQQALTEAKNFNNTNPRVKITFIEQDYAWADLESASGGVYTAQPIIDDIHDAAAEGFLLRAMITFKFGPLPAYLSNLNGGLNYDDTVAIKNQAGEDAGLNIRMDLANVRNRLKLLFTNVIQQIKNDSAAWNSFYGVVLQETALGTPKNPAFDWADVEDAWYDGLVDVHAHLYNQLYKSSAPAEPRRRLFWQMVNAPRTKMQWLIGTMMDANGGKGRGGLCGPDTFPKEPAGTQYSLAETYDLMRVSRTRLPISLHVYSENYRAPDHGGPFALQAIWNPAVGENDPLRNSDAADGIANFLGCVPHGSRNWANSMQVHNVVWSMADNEDTTPPIAPIGPTNWTGWKRAKEWMRTTSQTVADAAGGCNTTTPTIVTRNPN